MDENYQAGKAGLSYAANQGIGTVIMEPLRGGFLASNVPSDVQSIWDMAEVPRKPAEWALRYLWNNPEIDVVLSGMSTLDQMKENILFAKDSYPNSLTLDEEYLIKEVKMAYREKISVNCTACGYCMPCPEGVNIPDCFMHFNYAEMFNDPESAKMHYMTLLKDEEKASSCAECGECEMICPQMIDIKEKLKEVMNTFGR